MQPFYAVMYTTTITEYQTWKQRFTTWRTERDKLTGWRYQTYQMYFRTALHANDAFVIG